MENENDLTFEDLVLREVVKRAYERCARIVESEASVSMSERVAIAAAIRGETDDEWAFRMGAGPGAQLVRPPE